MAGLIKEMLLDYGMDRLSFDQRIDILTAIQQLRQSRVLDISDIMLLDLYVAGYTSDEISYGMTGIYGTLITTQDVDSTLTRVITAIENASGYTDSALVHKVEKNKDYPRSKVQKLSEYLTQHSREFGIHDI